MTRNHRFTECKEFQISLSKLIKDQYNLATSSIWDQLTCWLARTVCYLLQVESHIRPQSLRLTDSQTVTGARVEDFRPLYERMTFDTRSSFCSKRPRRVFFFFWQRIVLALRNHLPCSSIFAQPFCTERVARVFIDIYTECTQEIWIQRNSSTNFLNF